MDGSSLGQAGPGRASGCRGGDRARFSACCAGRGGDWAGPGGAGDRRGEEEAGEGRDGGRGVLRGHGRGRRDAAAGAGDVPGARGVLEPLGMTFHVG